MRNYFRNYVTLYVAPFESSTRAKLLENCILYYIFAIRLFVFFRSGAIPRRPFASARAEIGRRFLGGCKNRIFVKSSAMIRKTGREGAESSKFFVTAPFHRECPHVSALTPSRLGALKIKAFCAVFALGKRVCDREQHASEGGGGHNAHARSIFDNS